EDEEEERRVRPPNLSPEKAKELEDERREVIRSQALRKSGTMAEKWSSMDELSSIATGSQAEGRHKGSYSPSFAVCFDKPSPGRAATPVDPENIDTEQINFSAARQQFLMLEKTNPGSLLSPGQQAMSPKPELVTKVQEWQSAETAAPAARAHSSLVASRPARSTTEVFDTLAPSRAGGNGSEQGAKSSGETPIEREIRMAMEREENLWKERGIPRLTSSSELVEIQTKPLLSVSLSPLPGRKGKDKGRTSFYVQREIEQETKREEDLKREGRLLGAYDRGTPQELDQRRRVFQQEEPQLAAAPRRAGESHSSWVNGSAAEPGPGYGLSPAEGARGGKRSPVYTVNLTQFQASQPRFVAATGERSRDDPRMDTGASAGISNWASEDSRAGRLPGSTPSPVDRAILRKEYFSLPFWKPRVSFVDTMGTQSPVRRERGAEGAAAREEQYSLRTWKPQTSVLIEEEIRSDLQREEELQEQRRRWRRLAGEERTRSPLSSQSSAASGASGSYSVSGSPLPSPALHHGGVLALASAFTPLRVAGPVPGSAEALESGHSGPVDERRRRVKEDGKYAGIEPIDKINTEVVESTRVIRHKSDMAKRWEAGQYVRDDE
ncbi:MISP protein, partial [Nothocercus nigrocapillus]|nr:MISP protein [Nothocercus nigrocapillus]